MRTSTAPHVKPFPWEDLPATSERFERAAKRLREAASAVFRLDDVATVLTDLLGVPVTIDREAFAAAPERGADAVGLLLAAGGREGPGARVLLAAPGALAAALAARALRTIPGTFVDAARSASPAVCGAVAAVVVATARRAHGARSLVVVAAGPVPELAKDVNARVPHDPVTLGFRVRIGRESFRATVTADAATIGAAAGDAPRSAAAKARLAALPIALPVVASVTLASRQDLAALSAGDVLVPQPRSMALHGEGPRAAIVGPVVLLAPQAEEGLGCDLAPDGRLVLRRLRVASPWDPPARSEAPREPPMPDDLASATDTLTSLEDAPVVIRVELGVLEMTAGAYAALEPGDVIPLGRRLGDPAILRAGGHEVGRGELVLVDGEVGIRVLHGPREGA